MPALAARREEQIEFWITEGQQALDDERPRNPANALDPGPARRPRAGKDGAADEIGCVEEDLLRDEAAEREANQVGRLQSQRPDRGDRVGGHFGHTERCRAAGITDTAVVERIDRPNRRQTLDDPGIEIVEVGAPVIEQHNRHPNIRPEPAISETRAGSLNVLGRCYLPVCIVRVGIHIAILVSRYRVT